MIGVGHVARNGHLPGWRGRPEATLVAAADARPEGREGFLASFPQGRWYPSAEELLSRETLDFADVCTPPALHPPIARAALEAGLHVLCEKPLALSPAEVASLAALARRKGRALVTVHNWKHAPALAKVTELLREGAVGRLRRARWETLRREPAVAAGEKGNWRLDPAQSGGGILVDHGWHALYVLRQWLGGRPAALSARLETRKHREFSIEDTAAVSLDWDGAEVEVFLTWAAEERGNRVEIEGERGKLRLDGGRLELSVGGLSPQSW
ncbi:MAG: Gfo/Idh/MocA family protein, partial [Thermoanaerobaculia bacterium]